MTIDKILKERSLKDILEEIDTKEGNSSDSFKVYENSNDSGPVIKYTLSKEDAKKEIQKAFARLSKFNNGVLEDMYNDGILRFKRKVLGYAWTSPKLYTSDEFVSKLIELNMFDSEEKAKEILPHFDNWDVTMWSFGSFCDGIHFRYVDGVDNNKLWRIGVYHRD